MNNRQRHFLANRASNKAETVTSEDSSVSDDSTVTLKSAANISIRDSTFVTTASNSQRTRNDISVYNSRSYISILRDISERTICRKCDEVDHYANDCSHSRINQMTRIHEMSVEDNFTSQQ